MQTNRVSRLHFNASVTLQYKYNVRYDLGLYYQQVRHVVIVARRRATSHAGLLKLPRKAHGTGRAKQFILNYTSVPIKL